MSVETLPALTEPQTIFLDALMSGEYVQTTARLRGETMHNVDKLRLCCMGVACETYRTRATLPGESALVWERVRGVWAFLGATHAMPTEVSSWLGVTRNPRLWRDTVDNREREGTSAGAANDAYRLSFEVLAGLFYYHFTHNGELFVGSIDDVQALANKHKTLWLMTKELKEA